MNFVSSLFVAFLAVVFILFVYLPERCRKPLLLVASYLFYATWSVPFVGVILLSTTTDYWLSHLIVKADSPQRKKALLIFGLIINLGILGFFKYFNFFLNNVHGLANAFGQSVPIPESLSIILPLGISFYTFEAVSYLADVYRGKAPARNWFDYNFYIMYFPHLISGPIIRYGELWPQYKEHLKLPDMTRFSKALELILLGFAFKVLIADQVATMANPVFAAPGNLSVLTTYVGVLAFTAQIYFDFMGYTHIARGISLLFNIEMPVNFNHPYVARNISDFWNRWHMSLSRWIRDYLYFPLGGSRCSLERTVFNLFITMLICGAWHGAGWTFILWGAYHGVLLAAYHLWQARRKAVGGLDTLMSHPAYRLLSIGGTFLCVIVGWVLFRAVDLPSAGVILSRMFNVPGLAQELTAGSGKEIAGLLGKIALLLFLCFSGPLWVKLGERLFWPMPVWGKVQVACIVGFICWLVATEQSQPFIYFQF